MKRRDMSTLSLVTQLGLTVVTALVLSLLLGIWLDSQLGTKPILTLAFSLFGIIVGTVGVYRLVTRAIEDSVAQTPRTLSTGKATTPAGANDDAGQGEADPWADDEADKEDRDPWNDEEAERRLGLRPPKVKPTKPEDEQK